MGGTPSGVLQSEELMEIFLPILRADFKIVETYIHDKIHNHVILIFLYLMGKMMNLLHMIK